MAAILKKCSKVHFVCDFFLATSEIYNLGALSFPMMYVSLCPSLDTDKANFRGLCNGLFIEGMSSTWLSG